MFEIMPTRSQSRYWIYLLSQVNALWTMEELFWVSIFFLMLQPGEWIREIEKNIISLIPNFVTLRIMGRITSSHLHKILHKRKSNRKIPPFQCENSVNVSLAFIEAECDQCEMMLFKCGIHPKYYILELILHFDIEIWAVYFQSWECWV